jgi:hypothetical protein
MTGCARTLKILISAALIVSVLAYNYEVVVFILKGMTYVILAVAASWHLVR